MFSEKEVSLEERKEKVKSMRDQRKAESSGLFIFVNLEYCGCSFQHVELGKKEGKNVGLLPYSVKDPYNEP